MVLLTIDRWPGDEHVVGCLKITKRQAIEKQNFGRVSAAPRREGRNRLSRTKARGSKPSQPLQGARVKTVGTCFDEDVCDA